MDAHRGARAVLIVVGVSMAIGLVVLIMHPAYRGTLAAWIKGEKADAPIRRSNARYYPSVGERP